MSYSRLWLVALATFLFAGCMVGPKYKRPSAPATPGYKEPPPDSFKESALWKTAKPMSDMLRGNWWEVFGDAQLNTLEAQVTVAN